ncbi:hypothetical protein BH10ACT7_BH10ACT7_32660 [soil metagenome]
MRRWKLSTDQSGSASLEFVALGVLLLVPVVYLMVALAAIQAGALAVEGAARQGVRVFVQGDDLRDARAAAARAIAFALADHGVDPDSAEVALTCTPDPDRCLARRGFVTVTIDVIVPLPFAPPVLAAAFPLAVPLRATATQQVSRFAGSG